MAEPFNADNLYEDDDINEIEQVVCEPMLPEFGFGDDDNEYDPTTNDDDDLMDITPSNFNQMHGDSVPSTSAVVPAIDIETQQPVSSSASNLYSKEELNQLFVKMIQNDLKDYGNSRNCIRLCEEQVYESTEAFVREVWSFYKSADVSSTRLADVKSLLRKLLTCPDCIINRYFFPEDHVVRPCREPHTLIWYKRRVVITPQSHDRIQLVLPAKILYIDLKEEKVMLQVFNHKFKPLEVLITITSLQQKLGYYMTEDYPFTKETYRLIDLEVLQTSTDILNEHIRQLESQFGDLYHIYYQLKQNYICRSHLLIRKDSFYSHHPENIPKPAFIDILNFESPSASLPTVVRFRQPAFVRSSELPQGERPIEEFYTRDELNDILFQVLTRDLQDFLRDEQSQKCMARCKWKKYETINDFINDVLEYYQNQAGQLTRLTDINRLMRLLMRCPDCVISRHHFSSDHITAACRVPHTLIWYKRSLKYKIAGGQGDMRVTHHVPAKVLYVDKKSLTLALCLFEAKARKSLELQLSLASVTAAGAFLMTENSPFAYDPNVRLEDMDLLEKSLAVMKKHVRNLKTRHGDKYQIYASGKTMWNGCSDRLPSSQDTTDVGNPLAIVSRPTNPQSETSNDDLIVEVMPSEPIAIKQEPRESSISPTGENTALAIEYFPSSSSTQVESDLETEETIVAQVVEVLLDKVSAIESNEVPVGDSSSMFDESQLSSNDNDSDDLCAEIVPEPQVMNVSVKQEPEDEEDEIEILDEIRAPPKASPRQIAELQATYMRAPTNTIASQNARIVQVIPNLPPNVQRMIDNGARATVIETSEIIRKEGSYYTAEEFTTLMKLILIDMVRRCEDRVVTKCLNEICYRSRQCETFSSSVDLLVELQRYELNMERCNFHGSKECLGSYMNEVRKVFRRAVKCFDCVYNEYRHSYDYQVRLCRPPHLLVWLAKTCTRHVNGRDVSSRVHVPAKIVNTEKTPAGENFAYICILSTHREEHNLKIDVDSQHRHEPNQTLLLTQKLTNNVRVLDSFILNYLRQCQEQLQQHIQLVRTTHGPYTKFYVETKIVWDGKRSRMYGFRDPCVANDLSVVGPPMVQHMHTPPEISVQLQSTTIPSILQRSVSQTSATQPQTLTFLRLPSATHLQPNVSPFTPTPRSDTRRRQPIMTNSNPSLLTHRMPPVVVKNASSTIHYQPSQLSRQQPQVVRRNLTTSGQQQSLLSQSLRMSQSNPMSTQQPLESGETSEKLNDELSNCYVLKTKRARNLYEMNGKFYDLDEIKANQPTVKMTKLTFEDCIGLRVQF